MSFQSLLNLVGTLVGVMLFGRLGADDWPVEV
jgi:hypothetical protein